LVVTPADIADVCAFYERIAGETSLAFDCPPPG
jgi:hypothetical protein